MIPTDSSGNSIIPYQEGNLISLYLKLTKEKFKRKLGIVDCSSRVMTTFRNRERHLHLKSFGYGWNHYLLKNATRFDKILLDEKFGKERHKYLIPVSLILEKGYFLNFAKQGYELQIFLNFEIVKTFEIK